tara:strand:- start:249 stop:434 length:186 start_codon:yes stop_codon:yes gene_type:complete
MNIMPHFQGLGNKHKNLKKKDIQTTFLLIDLDIKKMLKDTADIKDELKELKELILKNKIQD